MTKEQFEKQYGEQLKLSEKKWILMSPKANKENNLVVISGYKEIDFDYLYFIYKDEVWEMALIEGMRFYNEEIYNTRELFQLCLNTKKNIQYTPVSNKILYRNTGVKGQIIIALDYFASKIKSVLDPTTIEVAKEVLDTKTITPKTIKDLKMFLENLGYHSSIINYVCDNIKEEEMCVDGNWNVSYLDVMIENARFNEEDIQRKAWEASTQEFNKEISKIRTFETGSMRDDDSEKPLVNHLDPYLRLRYGYLLREGAKKYSKGNWKLGQPDEVALESLHRHLAKYELNLKNNIPQEEDHLSAIIFACQLLMINEEKQGIKVNEYVGTTN